MHVTEVIGPKLAQNHQSQLISQKTKPISALELISFNGENDL